MTTSIQFRVPPPPEDFRFAHVSVATRGETHTGSHHRRDGLHGGRLVPRWWKNCVAVGEHLRHLIYLGGERGWLRLEEVPDECGTQLVQTAIFESIELAGHLCWNLLCPVHKINSPGLVRASASRDEGRFSR